MKTLTHWLLALTLPVFASTAACDDKDDDDGGDDGGDDDGGDDGDDDGDDGDGDDDGGDGDGDDDGFPTDDGGDDGPPTDDDGGDDDGGDDGPSGGQVGDQCMADSDCADNACLFAGDVDYGFCSKVCDSFSDCPSFWECEPVGNASADYCVPG